MDDFSGYWQIEKETKKECLLELRSPDGWRKATILWDGFVSYQRFFNWPEHSRRRSENSVDLVCNEIRSQVVHTLHIGSIDEEINYLTALKLKAIEFFGEDWEA